MFKIAPFQLPMLLFTVRKGLKVFTHTIGVCFYVCVHMFVCLVESEVLI